MLDFFALTVQLAWLLAKYLRRLRRSHTNMISAIFHASDTFEIPFKMFVHHAYIDFELLLETRLAAHQGRITNGRKGWPTVRVK